MIISADVTDRMLILCLK